jgi:hypothetical protein
MNRTLALFWLRRFTLIFVAAALGLGLVERVQQGATGSYTSVLGWSALVGLVAASLATTGPTSAPAPCRGDPDSTI